MLLEIDPLDDAVGHGLETLQAAAAVAGIEEQVDAGVRGQHRVDIDIRTGQQRADAGEQPRFGTDAGAVDADVGQLPVGGDAGHVLLPARSPGNDLAARSFRQASGCG